MWGLYTPDCAELDLLCTKLSVPVTPGEIMGRAVLQISHPPPQIFPHGPITFPPHFFLSLARMCHSTLRSCLALLPLYGNIPHVPSSCLFIRCRNGYGHSKIGKSDIAMDISRKRNLNRSKKARFQMAIRSALHSKNNCTKMFQQTRLDCKQAFSFTFIFHSKQVFRFFFLFMHVTERPVLWIILSA